MNKKIGFIAMLISATGMGLVGTLGRLSTPVDPTTGTKYITGDFLAAGRMLTGALGFLLIVLLTKKWQQMRSTRLSFAVIAGGLSIGTSLALYVSSTLMTTIANAVFLIYTGPLFSALLARIFLKEKIRLANAVCLVLVFLGMVMTVGLVNLGPDGLSFGLDLGANPELPNKTVGDLFGLGSGLFYGLALFFYRYRGDIPSEVRGVWNFVFGAVGAGLVMVLRIRFLDDTNPFRVMTRSNWSWAVVLFLVCGLLAIGLLVVAGKNLMAVELSTTSYWECLVALLLGALIWHESMTLIGAIGGALILLGGLGPIIYDVALAPRRRRMQAEAEASPQSVPEPG
ncbi:EamA-like transporter family protein [Luteococcus japonicus]|uniref:EamA-like transporter family protein n=1 Tax=Luteococcus japonicus TaxID=33984 RepID=A0A3N1ZVP2_9ACTN|nr:EamA family transporter [Luteococcus japonicus]ROR54905.1 EamA-like transporter family protein [Luteococcus japonicus]